ncbi:MAG: hypothetical protein Q8918_04825 [Bacteroidota bacterium]|nr:hypothetical protein [Bacteroidota bacterium]MDP4211182.1 hypothetical protein [Bacteroidota bacterium]MDP4249420.1 hypothetical protein [Bacteroidota bacterium]
MKNIMLCLISGMFLIASCGPVQVVQTESYEAAPEPAPAVSYQSFYDDLSPYGTWINHPGYGYVWMPNAGPDFMPYSTNGNWIYTDAGWTWASDYNWGWATFHYGRWFYEGGYGWMWVPGNEWAPAWVSWRGGNDYYGWAPLGPNVSVDVALGSYNPPMNYWNFVPRRYMGNPRWQQYHVDQSRNVTIINNTTIINNYSGTNRARYAYAPGPDPAEVRRVSGANIRPVQIREANTPGSRVSGNQYNIYRPRIDATPSNRPEGASRPAPARVQTLRDVRPQLQNQGDNNRPAPQPVVPNPNNNYRPAPQPAAPNPNNNNRPETRPALQNPNYNNRPVAQPAVQNPNSNRPATQPALQNPSYNNRRVPQPSVQTPNNSNRPVSAPVLQPAQANPSPAVTGRPSDSRFNQRGGNPVPAQQQSLPQPSPANRQQMHLRPAAPAQNPQSARQAPRQVQPQPVNRNPPKPDDKKTERPATRRAN